MKKSFLGNERPILTAMLPFKTPKEVIDAIEKSIKNGAEAFGLQTESLYKEYYNEETLKRIFAATEGRPMYVTYYRTGENEGMSDDELAEGLLKLADWGATLVDVMGDLFCRHPEELTDNPDPVKKQMDLIEELHNRGAEVLMSSHILKFTPAERILEIALEQKRRGADIIKIVSSAETMAEQIENLRIADLLKKELDAPFLFLSSGESYILRRLGVKLGCCMCLCVYQHDKLSAAVQPLLSTMKTLRDCIDF